MSVPGDTFDEFVEECFAECDEHLSAIRRVLRSVTGRSPRVFQGIEFLDVGRRLQTLTSLAKILELPPAAEVGEVLESAFHGTIAPGTSVSADALGVLATGVGVLDRSIQSKRGWHPDPDHDGFLSAARDFLGRRGRVYESATSVIHSPAPPGGGIETAEDSRRVAVVPPPSPRQDSGPSDPSANAPRLDVARVDDVMQTIGELVILRCRLEESLRRAANTAMLDDLRGTHRALERQLRSLREGVLRLRRVPIDVLFERIRATTGDMFHGAEGTVRLQFGGEQTLIDIVMVDRLLEPLLHLVRIAALHHIERPAARIARGKPPHGRIVLRAAAAGDRVVVEAEDDGAGHDVGDLGSGSEAHAGRFGAIGRAITALGGELWASSVPGFGTKFSIGIPIGDLISDALLVAVGDQVMAVPLRALREVVRLEPEMMTSLGGSSMIAHRGSALPLLMLRRHFELLPAAESRPHVLVAESGGHRLGLVVDDVIGIREIVARPLSDAGVAERGIAGATELGDGRLALVVDATRLMRRARSSAPDAGATAAVP